MTGLLVHIVLTRNVIPVNRLVWIPEKPLGKLCGVGLSKNVIVGDGTPYGKGSLTFSSVLNIGNVGIWDEIFHDCAKNVILMRGCNSRSLSNFLWNRVCESLRLRVRNYFSRNTNFYISSRRTAGINEGWLSLKLNTIVPFLVQSSPYDHRKISSDNGFIATLDNVGNILHCISGASRLPDVAFHCFRLLPSGFNGLTQLNGLVPENNQLQNADGHNEASKDDISSSQNHQFPVVRRLICAILGLLGGFFLCLRGWNSFYKDRKFFASALIVSSLLLGICGLMLLWLTSLRWCWGWYL